MEKSFDDESSSAAFVASLSRLAADAQAAGQLHKIFGGFCHELRNHLNVLKMTFYLVELDAGAGCASSGADWTEARAAYESLEGLVERFHQICRASPVHPVTLPIGLLLEDCHAAWQEALRPLGRRLVIDRPPVKLLGRFDPMRLGAALEDLFRWRLHAAQPGATLRVAWRGGKDRIILEWEEIPETSPPTTGGPRHAPGPAPSFLERFSLPSLAQVIALHGGVMALETSPHWRIRMEWPAPPLDPQESPASHERADRRGRAYPALDLPLRPVS